MNIVTSSSINSSILPLPVSIARAIQTVVAGNILMGLAMLDISQNDRLNSTFDNLGEFISK